MMGCFLYSDAVREFARARKCNGYKKLANQTYLYRRGAGQGQDYFAVKLYNTEVVHIYPDHQQIFCRGWPSQLTFKAINNFSCLRGWITTNSRCGFDEVVRINDLPFFDGIRIDNAGRVFPEDVRSDWKRVVDPKVTAEWKKLHMPLTKSLRGRFELGEFDGVDYDQGNTITQANILLEKFLMLDREFPEHDRVVDLLTATPVRVAGKGWNVWRELDVEARWKWLLDVIRPRFYEDNNAYLQVEVRN